MLGIDPGLSGALAFLGLDGSIHEIEDMPLLGRQVNAHLMARLIQGYGPIKMAVVESAHSMPKQGIAGDSTTASATARSSVSSPPSTCPSS